MYLRRWDGCHAAAQVSDQEWDTEVLKSPVPVLVDFWAPWCGPCRMIAPTVDELASEYGSKLKVVNPVCSGLDMLVYAVTCFKSHFSSNMVNLFIYYVIRARQACGPLSAVHSTSLLAE